MKPLLPNKGKKQSKIILVEDDRVVTDSSDVAEIFNEYFCDVAVNEGTDRTVEDLTTRVLSLLLKTAMCSHLASRQ